MSAITSPAPFAPARAADGLRFGRESVAGAVRSVQWLSTRNNSLAPRQMLWGFAGLSTVSLLIAAAFWSQGATLVMPFAWLELGALALALIVHSRHARDSESIRLEADRLTVEHACGRRTERVEFLPAWVRVEPESGERSLVELSGQGRRISVGRYVRPELRSQLAEELRWALRRWPAGSVRSAV